MSVVLRSIRKHFGSVRACDGVDLEVASGELHGLLGENGAGKSTLMKVLSGFIAADSGSIELDGEALPVASPRAALAHGIGMLHQDPLVFLPFTVLDNFVLGGPSLMATARRAPCPGGDRRPLRIRLDPDVPAAVSPSANGSDSNRPTAVAGCGVILTSRPPGYRSHNGQALWCSASSWKT
jgi:ABC-type Fe3+/spermidine/putrescine transport system ATPase subunit